MRRKFQAISLGIGLIIILIMSLVIGGCAKPEAAPSTTTPSTPSTPVETVVLKYASYAPPTHDGTIIAQEIFPMVETLTEGRVKVEVYHSESLVAVGETIDALDRGIADLAFIPLPYITGQMPWIRVTLIPGMIKDFRGAYDAFKYGLTDMVQQGFHDMGLKIEVVNTPFTPGTSLLLTKGKRVAVPDDLKGMKIACPSKGDRESMELCGASPVAMTGAENYESLSRGVVDGVISNIGGYYGHKIYEVGDYLTMVPAGAAVVAVLASETGLSKLSPTDRAIVMYVAERRSIEEAFALATGESRMITEMTPALKEVVQPTNAEMSKWKEVWAPLLQGYLEQTGETGQKAVEIIQKYNP